MYFCNSMIFKLHEMETGDRNYFENKADINREQKKNAISICRVILCQKRSREWPTCRVHRSYIRLSELCMNKYLVEVVNNKFNLMSRAIPCIWSMKLIDISSKTQPLVENLMISQRLVNIAAIAVLHSAIFRESMLVKIREKQSKQSNGASRKRNSVTTLADCLLRNSNRTANGKIITAYIMYLHGVLVNTIKVLRIFCKLYHL